MVQASCAWQPDRCDAWDEGCWWVSGGSCGGMVVCLHLEGGSKVKNRKDPLQSQSTKRQQGTKRKPYARFAPLRRRRNNSLFEKHHLSIKAGILQAEGSRTAAYHHHHRESESWKYLSHSHKQWLNGHGVHLEAGACVRDGTYRWYCTCKLKI